MVRSDRIESAHVAALITEDPDSTATTTQLVTAVVNAMAVLERVGLRVVLIDGTSTKVAVRRSKDRRHRWWGRERKEK